ncbi:MAG: hypothetical protein U5K55_00835 [Aliarcobacter sp.]|nr:hypothetical protein [Aliarcobacter sp.]
MTKNSFKFVEKITKKLLFGLYDKTNQHLKIFFLKKDLIHDIKSAIKNKRYVNIRYFSDKEFIFEEAKILKIIFTDGNFYIATLTDDELNNGFKFLRLNFITQLELFKKIVFKELLKQKYF